VQSKLIALRPLHLQPLELFIQENITVGPRVSVLGTLRLYFVWPITVTEDNQMNQSDIKPRTCPLRKERDKAYQQVMIGFELNFDWLRKWRPNIVKKGLGCVPLGWFGLESVIRDHSDHGKSNEPMKTFKRIDWSSPLMCYNPIDPITEPVPVHPSGTRFKFHQKKLWRGVGGELNTKFDFINWAIKTNLSPKKKKKIQKLTFRA